MLTAMFTEDNALLLDLQFPFVDPMLPLQSVVSRPVLPLRFELLFCVEKSPLGCIHLQFDPCTFLHPTCFCNLNRVTDLANFFATLQNSYRSVRIEYLRQLGIFLTH